MPRKVQYNGVTQQFPDDATDDEVRAALEGHTPDRGLLGDLWEGAKGVGEMLAAPVTAFGALSKLSPLSSEGGQMQRAKEMFVDPVLDQQKKAKEDIAAGRTAYGVQRGLIGSVPMVGPAITDVSDKIVNPETRARGVGNAIGAAVPYMLPRAGRAVAPALQDSAETQYQQALRPTKEKLKIQAAKITPQAIEKGLTGSIDSLGEQAATGLENAGAELNSAHAAVAAQSPTVVSSIQPIIGALDKLQQKSVTNGVTTDPSRLKAIDHFKSMLTDIATNDANGGPQDVSFESLMKARQDLDRQIGDFHIQPNPQSDLSVMKRTADAMRHELAQASPDIAKINAEYSFWKNFGKVVDSTKMRTTSQAPGLLGWIAGASAGGGAYAHSGSAGEAVLAAATVKGLQKLVSSPQWKTTSAVAKSRLADLLSNGDQAAANAYIAAQLVGSGVPAAVYGSTQQQQ